MIVRPNAESSPNWSDSKDAMNGHSVKFHGDFRNPTPMNGANVHHGGGNAGFGFATDPTGVVDYPRPNPTLPGLPGINGEGV
jgi:hypothetical protein